MLSGPLGKCQLQGTRGWQRITSFCSLSEEVPAEKLRIYASGLINRLPKKFRSEDPTWESEGRLLQYSGQQGDYQGLPRGP